MDTIKLFEDQIAAYKKKLLHDLEGAKEGGKIKDFGEAEVLALLRACQRIKDIDTLAKVEKLIGEFNNWRSKYTM